MDRSSLLPRTAGSIGLAVALLVALPLAANAAPSGTSTEAQPTRVPSIRAGCTVKALPEPANTTNSEVHAGDAKGRWLVGSAVVADAEQPTIWRKGKLYAPPVSPLTSFDGVDRQGTIVGWGRVDTKATAGAIVMGEYVALASPAGALHTYAVAVNGDRVAGQAELESGPIVPVVWSLASPGTVTVLAMPAGYVGFSTGIGAKGEVIVDAMNMDGTVKAYKFDTRMVRTELAPPAGVTAVHAADVAGKRVAAWVEGADQAVRFNLRNGKGVVVATPLQVSATNAKGVLGGSDRETRAPGLVLGKKTKALPTLVKDGFGGVAVITKAGDAAGVSERSSGNEAAVRWTC